MNKSKIMHVRSNFKNKKKSTIMNTPKGRKINSISIKPMLEKIQFRKEDRWRNKTVESLRISSTQG